MKVAKSFKTSLLIGLLLLLGSFAAGVFAGKRLKTKSPTRSLPGEGFVKETLYTLGGTVEAVDDAALMLKRNEKTLKILVDDKTKLNLLTKVRTMPAGSTASGRRVGNPEVSRDVRLHDLRRGDRATIKAILTKGKFLAKTISATR
jgi:hypothetical protein